MLPSHVRSLCTHRVHDGELCVVHCVDALPRSPVAAVLESMADRTETFA